MCHIFFGTHPVIVIFTDRIRSTRVRYCFHSCLSVYGGGSTPRYLPSSQGTYHPGQALMGRGDTPGTYHHPQPTYLSPWPGPDRWRGYPKVPNLWSRYLPLQPDLDRGRGYPKVPTPSQVQMGGTPRYLPPQPRYLPPPAWSQWGRQWWI